MRNGFVDRLDDQVVAQLLPECLQIVVVIVRQTIELLLDRGDDRIDDDIPEGSNARARGPSTAFIDILYFFIYLYLVESA